VVVELEALLEPIKELVVLIPYSALLHLLAAVAAALCQMLMAQMVVLAVAQEILVEQQVVQEIHRQHLHLKEAMVEMEVVTLALPELAVVAAVHQRLVAQEKQLEQV
jgi:hypothetical protein